MARIAVIAGVASERALLEGFPNVTVALSGANPDGAARAVQKLLADKPDGLLSFGTAGGIDPALEPGALIVADRVVGADGVTRETDPAWRRALADALGVEPGGISGADAVIDVSGKDRLWRERQTSAVDMESHVAARLAAEAGVPFAALRAVVDPHDRGIPAWVSAGVRADGSTDVMRILAGLCRHPGDLGTLLGLGRDHARGMSTLRGAVGILGPGLGFPG